MSKISDYCYITQLTNSPNQHVPVREDGEVKDFYKHNCTIHFELKNSGSTDGSEKVRVPYPNSIKTIELGQTKKLLNIVDIINYYGSEENQLKIFNEIKKLKKDLSGYEY